MIAEFAKVAIEEGKLHSSHRENLEFQEVDWKGARPPWWKHLESWLEYKRWAKKYHHVPDDFDDDDRSGDVPRTDDVRDSDIYVSSDEDTDNSTDSESTSSSESNVDDNTMNGGPSKQGDQSVQDQLSTAKEKRCRGQVATPRAVTKSGRLNQQRMGISRNLAKTRCKGERRRGANAGAARRTEESSASHWTETARVECTEDTQLAPVATAADDHGAHDKNHSTASVVTTLTALQPVPCESQLLKRPADDEDEETGVGKASSASKRHKPVLPEALPDITMLCAPDSDSLPPRSIDRLLPRVHRLCSYPRALPSIFPPSSTFMSALEHPNDHGSIMHPLEALGLRAHVSRKSDPISHTQVIQSQPIPPALRQPSSHVPGSTYCHPPANLSGHSADPCPTITPDLLMNSAENTVSKHDSSPMGLSIPTLPLTGLPSVPFDPLSSEVLFGASFLPEPEIDPSLSGANMIGPYYNMDSLNFGFGLQDDFSPQANMMNLLADQLRNPDVDEQFDPLSPSFMGYPSQ
ncbi:hypothetical protein RhiJN_27230 [Ceratobasidium sp. AG-Ba]|nr:hypothetical protein RhiJN_27230 [Ceratobasidium sp. AG-Ba]